MVHNTVPLRMEHAGVLDPGHYGIHGLETVIPKVFAEGHIPAHLTTDRPKRCPRLSCHCEARGRHPMNNPVLVDEPMSIGDSTQSTYMFSGCRYILRIK